MEANAGGEKHETRFFDAWSEVRDGKLERFVVHEGERIAKLSPENGVPKDESGGCSVAKRAHSASALSAAVALLALFALGLAWRLRRGAPRWSRSQR